MDQASLKTEYDRNHSTGSAERIHREMKAKLALIVGGAKPSEIVCLKNEKTGGEFYTRKK